MTRVRIPFRRLSLLTMALVVLGASTSLADSISYNASIPVAPTNWSNSMTFPKFDSQQNCLDSICVSLAGHVQGMSRFESLDGTPTTITMNMQATLTLQRPDLSTLVVTIPLTQTVDNATAFDGVIDFGGTSGKTYTGLAADKTEANCTHTAADLALFSGSGNITLPVVAAGSSNGSGAGNLILQFATDASAGATVTYYFTTCVVPAAPATWGTIKALYR